jgi:hypothetical protein
MTGGDARIVPQDDPGLGESAQVKSGPTWRSATHPVLFAAYPVLFLWSRNLTESEPGDVLPPLLVTTAAATLMTIALGIVLRDVRRAALILTPLIIGLLVYGHATRLTRAIDLPSLAPPLAWTTAIALAVILAFRLPARHLERVGSALTWFGAILIAVTLVPIVPFQLTNAGSSEGMQQDEALATTTDAPKRDVYWFIFDRYGSDRALDLLYGIDNDLTPWLRDEGFTVLDNAHPNYVKTSLSIATTSQMTHIMDVPGVPGPETTSQAFLFGMIRTSAVAKQFKALGYRYINIGSWWSPTRSSPLADVNLHTGGPDELTSSLLEASALPSILGAVGAGTFNSRTRHWENNQYGLDAVASVKDEPGPKFVFTHILLPHPPYVHARDGHFLTPEEMQGRHGETLFRDQLAYANTRLREIIGGLLALPEDRRPIIILQADEGPETPKYRATRTTTWNWHNASTEELEIKFGIMNAWFVPGDRQVGLYPGLTSINTFPLLFRDYFGLDYTLREDRVFALDNTYDQPYDLLEITDRLPPP